MLAGVAEGEAMKIICSCCGRQIVSYPCTPDKYITPGPAVSLGWGNWCCAICGKDLDENGMFPGEG